jgi:hypothetical protein
MAATPSAPQDDPLADIRSALANLPSATLKGEHGGGQPTATAAEHNPLDDIGRALSQTPLGGIAAGIGAAAEGLSGLGSAVHTATAEVPVVGGLVGAAGNILGQVGEAGGRAIPETGEQLGAAVRSAQRIPDDWGAITGAVTPPKTPEGFDAPTGLGAAPALAGDVLGSIFGAIGSVGPLLNTGKDLVGAPLTAAAFGPVTGQAALATGIAGLLTGNADLSRRAEGLAQTTARGLTDPTRFQRAYQSEANRLVGDWPVVGGLADFVTGGQLFNPLNLVGFETLGPAGLVGRATRGVPVLREAVQALNAVDRGISWGLGAPITVPLKVFGALGRRVPVLGQLTKESKFREAGVETFQTVNRFLTGTGTVEDLGRIAAGHRPPSLNNFAPKEQQAILTVGKALGEAVAATGGRVTPTTEAELVHVLTTGLAKKYGIAPTTNPIAKTVNFAEASVKEMLLALSPSYYATNLLGNLVVGVMGGFLPAGEGVVGATRLRYGLPEKLAGGESFLAAQFGPHKGVLRTTPGVSTLAGGALNKGQMVENWSRGGAWNTRFNERIPVEIDKVIATLRREFPGMIDPQMEKRALAAMKSGIRPDQLAGIMKGEGAWFAHMKDWGEHRPAWQIEIADAEGKLAAGPDARDPGWKAFKDQTGEDLKKTVRRKADGIASNTWISSKEVQKQERQAFTQAYAALQKESNPERVLEMLYALRSATKHLADLSAEAKVKAAPLAGKANNKARQAVYRERHERASDFLEAASAATSLAKAHPYNDSLTVYPQAVRDAVEVILAGRAPGRKNLIDSLDNAVANMRRMEARAAEPANGITDDMMEAMWEQHHATQLDLIDEAGAEIQHLVDGAAQLRGHGFWDNYISELANGAYETRSANRANIGKMADDMIAEVDRWMAQLDNVPRDVARVDGLGLMESPARQEAIGRRAAQLWGEGVHAADRDGIDFGHKMLFNYGMTTNFDKMLSWIFPFSIWQTRAMPLFASQLASKPGVLAAVKAMTEGSEQAETEEGAVPASLRRGTFIRTKPVLDGLLSMMIGRPIQAFSDPFGSVFQGGPAQFDSPPFITKDQGTLGQAAALAGYFGGGLSLWPWWQAALNLTDQNGRQVSYGDLFAPSRALRYFGVDVESAWKRHLLQAQGIESETGDPFLDRRIRERVAQIAEEEGMDDQGELLRAMEDPANPLHIRAKAEASKESAAVSLLRWFLPLGVKTLSPGGKELAELEKRYNAMPAGTEKVKYLGANPALAASFQKNASEAKLEVLAGQADFYALGTERQREMSAAYYALPRDRQRAYADAHPKEFAEIRSLGSLRSKFRQDPANALTVAFMDASGDARDAGGALKVDEWLTSQGIPDRRAKQDTRMPLQDIAQQLAELQGQTLVAEQQEQGKLSAKIDAYYKITEPVRALQDRYYALPEGSRERSNFLRANRDLGAAWDQQRAMRDRDTELAAYVAWAAQQRKRGPSADTSVASFRQTRKAGGAPAPPRSTGTAQQPSARVA